MRMKSRKQMGFTLIEVIVVAVIIAVISAVAIPLYNGYLKDSRIRTAENVAGSAASFLGTAVAQFGIQAGTTVKYKVGAASWTNLGDITSFTDVKNYTTLVSTSTSPVTIGILTDTTKSPVNSFIIPTGIGLYVDGVNGFVKAKHVESAEVDATNSYYFKTR